MILAGVIAFFLLISPITSGINIFSNMFSTGDKVASDYNSWRLAGCPKRFISDHKVHYTCGVPVRVK